MSQKKTPAKKQNTTSAARRTSPLTSLPFMGPVLTLGQTIFGGGDPNPQQTAQQRGRAALVVNKTTGSDIANEVGSVVTGAASSAGRKAAGGEVNRKTVKEDVVRGYKQVQDDIALYKKNNPTEAALVENTIDGLSLLVGAQAARKLATKYLGKNGAGIGQLIKDGAKYVLPGAGGGAVIGASLDGDTKDRAVNALKEGGLGAALGVVLGPVFDRSARRAGVEIIPGPAPAAQRTNAPQLSSPRSQQPQVIEGRATVVNDGTVVRGQAPARRPALVEPSTATVPASVNSTNPNIARGTAALDETGRLTLNPQPGDPLVPTAEGPFQYRTDINENRIMPAATQRDSEALERQVDNVMANPDMAASLGLSRFATRDEIKNTLTQLAGFEGIRTPDNIQYVGNNIELNRTTPTIPHDFAPENINNTMTRNDWAILTGENPDTITFPAADNLARNNNMVQQAQAQGAQAYPATGYYGTNPENSYLVSPINQEQIARIGGNFNQDSVLTNRGLINQDGTLTPQLGVEYHSTRPDLYFTDLPIPGRENALFTVDLGSFPRHPDATRVPGDYPAEPYFVPYGSTIPDDVAHRFDPVTRLMYPENHPDAPKKTVDNSGMRELTPEETQMVSGGSGAGETVFVGEGDARPDAYTRDVEAGYTDSSPAIISPRGALYEPDGIGLLRHRDWPKGSFITPTAPQYGSVSGKKALDPATVEVDAVQTRPKVKPRLAQADDFKVGDIIQSGVSDRSASGYELRGYNGVLLEKPVQLQGGPDFARMQDNAARGLTWASTPSAAAIITNLPSRYVRDGIATPEANHYHVGINQRPTGVAFSHHGHETAIGTLHTLDKNVIENLNTIVKQKIEGLPDLTTPEGREAAKDFLNSSTGETRSKFMTIMGSAEAREAGMPDLGQLYSAITDRSLFYTPSNTHGRTINRIDGKFEGDTNHNTYAGGIKGRDMGSFEFAMPSHVMFPDVYRNNTGQMSLSGKSVVTGNNLAGLFQQGHAHQVVTQEVIDNIGEYQHYARKFGLRPSYEE